jgi:hypothetical protein
MKETGGSSGAYCWAKGGKRDGFKTSRPDPKASTRRAAAAKNRSINRVTWPLL